MLSRPFDTGSPFERNGAHDLDATQRDEGKGEFYHRGERSRSINGTNGELVKTKFVPLFTESAPLQLESGKRILEITVAYETYGTLNNEGTNAILICHALTANAHAAGYHSFNDQAPGWWDGLIGPGKAFDTDKYFVVCPNILGSCYGTTGPISTDSSTGEQYRMTFPQFTIRDIVKVQKRLLDTLGVTRLATLSGSSLGGMQVLEWAIMYPDFCATIIPISTSVKQSTWCIALNTAARAAIMSDPTWNNGCYDHQPANGLTIARMVGMISYRSAQEFEQRFGRKRQHASDNQFDVDNPFEIESYLHYQGQKLSSRFDANTYIYLSRAMDLHDVTRDRGDIGEVLSGIKAKTLCVGVSSDIRYPTSEQKEIVRYIPQALYAEIDSIHGHDAFLIEFKQLNAIISGFLEKERGVSS
ncbi:MAG: homoserine O-acetyltransferase [Ignavibacteria bacterium]|nr:homoserine O-acetyltransferase [Ignavibacteria bacterium]MBI3765354.1 homoserine O-acetyltransferase [Ignavibacteriales bacterium]